MSILPFSRPVPIHRERIWIYPSGLSTVQKLDLNSASFFLKADGTLLVESGAGRSVLMGDQWKYLDQRKSEFE